MGNKGVIWINKNSEITQTFLGRGQRGFLEVECTFFSFIVVHRFNLFLRHFVKK